MSRKIISLVSTIGLSAGLGTVLGINYERHNREKHLSHLRDLFNLPTIKAAEKESVKLPATQNKTLTVSKDHVDANVPSNATQIMRFGFPGYDSIKTNHDYVLSYDKKNRVPHWVYEHLSRTKMNVPKNLTDRNQSEFLPDRAIHRYFRATNEDYQGSGYDRGHLAAAANHRLSQASYQETFLLSNIAPQVGNGFNRHAWNDLEKMTRSLARNFKNVYVCSGPLYLPRRESDGRNYIRYEVIGQNNIAVPTHFFKVLIMETEQNDLELLSFILPNQCLPEKVDLNAFVVPIDSIERVAGLVFFNENNPPRFKKINGRRLF
ncbi:endonuclease G, mitochondrial-like [Lineus longissimus]|uniref:endonuclease G, mitochondrial-like n=1 Tax=Lineus longissimus TaxID=88925 RepID=UPI002B4D68B5